MPNLHDKSMELEVRADEMDLCTGNHLGVCQAYKCQLLLAGCILSHKAGKKYHMEIVTVMNTVTPLAQRPAAVYLHIYVCSMQQRLPRWFDLSKFVSIAHSCKHDAIKALLQSEIRSSL